MSFESLKPPQIPNNPPIVLNIIDEKEKALSPQRAVFNEVNSIDHSKLIDIGDLI